MSSSDKLIFLHVEKTAGTTVTDWLRSQYPPNSLCPCRGRDIELWPAELTNRYSLFSCHANIEDFRFLEGPRRVITFLRDPVERCISLYKYWTSYTESTIERHHLAGPRLAKSFGLRRLFSPTHQDQCRYLRNQYATAMCGHRFVSPSGRLWAGDDEVHQAALDTLSRLFFVGISEDVGESLHRLSSHLGVEDTFDGRVMNRTNQNHIISPTEFEEVDISSEITKETLDLITVANTIDLALYREAVTAFFGEPVAWRRLRCVFDLTRARLGGSDNWIICEAPGYVVFGPYIDLLRGFYTTTFTLQIDVRDAKTPAVLGHVDIVAELGRKPLRQAPILTDMFDDAGQCQLRIDFTIEVIEENVEFRVFLNQPGNVKVLSTTNFGKKLR